MNGIAIEPQLVFAETGMWMGGVKVPKEGWRIPYPPFVDTVEVDRVHGEELVLKPEYVPLITFAKHRIHSDGRWKHMLLGTPTPTGPPPYLL